MGAGAGSERGAGLASAPAGGDSDFDTDEAGDSARTLVDSEGAAFCLTALTGAPVPERAAPLAVQATLASAHLARAQGDAAAIERLRPDVAALFATADAAEGVQSFIERRKAQFQGR